MVEEDISKNNINKKTSVDYLDKDILNITSYTEKELENVHLTENPAVKEYDVELYESNFSNVSEKQVVKGKVVSINERGVLIDVGFKSEGLVDRSEFKTLPSCTSSVESSLTQILVSDILHSQGKSPTSKK